MHDYELNEILRVVDAPTRAPEVFRTTLLDELREAYETQGPAPTGDRDGEGILIDVEQSSGGDEAAAPAEIIPMPAGSDGRYGRRLRGGLLAVAAAALVLLALYFAPGDDSASVEYTEDAAPTVTTTTIAPLSAADACAELVLSTRPLGELAAAAEADPIVVVADLQVWRRAVDRFLQRSSTSLTPDEEADLLGARVLIRQAIDAPSNSTVLAVERYWRDLTEADPFSECRG